MADSFEATETRFTDDRILCPTTKEVCPSRQQIVRMYEGSLPNGLSESLPAELHPRLDSGKLVARLGEYTARAQLNGCDGPQEGGCPTREDMNNSNVRVGVVSALRKFLGKAH